MLDEFLRVAYQAQTRKQAEFEMIGLMKELPDLELRKIASGEAVSDLYGYLSRQKQADIICGDGTTREATFLDRFKGTPLFQQALQLEEQELQAEMEDIQRRQIERQEEKAMPRLWDVKDQLRLKKRLLELQRATQETGGAPEAPEQGAGAMGDVPAEGVQDNHMGVQGSKTASAASPRVLTLVKFAEEMGRKLARSDIEKSAQAGLMADAGRQAGVLLAKHALNLGALGGVASKALGFAVKHPTLTGAGVGALGGAAAASPGNRISGAMGGAALGSTVGGKAPALMQKMPSILRAG